MVEEAIWSGLLMRGVVAMDSSRRSEPRRLRLLLFLGTMYFWIKTEGEQIAISLMIPQDFPS
jgi:hypothetical protein